MRLAPHILEELGQPEVCATLRIIAADTTKLSLADRGVLLTAATELELAYRKILLDNEELSGAMQHIAALQDRVAVLTPKAVWNVGASVSVRWP